MSFLLKLSDLIEGLLRRIADAGAWAFIACIVVIAFDVITRKIGYQLPGFGSTRLQELEWHLHAVLFCTWLGYAYIRNSHVRIDIFSNQLQPRSKLWLELGCCVVFALPYLWVALPHAHGFFMTSFLQGESSDAPTGLPYRWVVKFFLYLAFITVQLAVISVMARCVVALFGTPEEQAKAHVPFAKQA
jgi:TRAP-type mannitol/chloroaromatic compound transport system permease small subunit